MVYSGHAREDVMDLYQRAAVCLVTPVDDGMNLVSKEFVVAASQSDDPGMLVLSQFAGTATDLSSTLSVHPSATDSVGTAIKKRLERDREMRCKHIEHIMSLLDYH